jgi:Flp pilus assembly secretin CpaC
VCLAAATVSLAAEPKASDLFRQGRKAERAGQIVSAYLLYSEAAAKDPSHPEYRLRADALQIRAALKAHAMPSTDASGHTSFPTVDIQPQPGFTTGIAEDELNELRRLKPPPQLKASAGTKTLDLSGNAKTLFEQATAAFGLGVAFDPEYEPGVSRHLHLDDVDYRQALRAAEAATGSFVFPIGEHLIMAVKDTQAKRVEFEPTIAVTVPIPDTLSPQDAQEVGRAVQQSLDIAKLSVDADRRLVLIRDRISRVRPAQALFAQLSHGRAQMALELQFLEVDRSSTLSYGLLVPNQFPISFLGLGGIVNLLSNPQLSTFVSLFGNAIPLSEVAHLNPIMFGVGIASSQIVAAMTKSSAKTLLDTTVRSLDGEAAEFHVGNKYPILTGQLLGGGATGTTGTLFVPGLPTAQGPLITSVQWQGNPGNYTLVVTGSGFGTSTVAVPFAGDVSNFAIEDMARQNEWGYTGDSDTLTFDAWSDSTIAVSGFGGQPGDAVIFALWNSSTQLGAAWGGTVPTSATTPQITSVQLVGSGSNTQIVVEGSGFGPSPSTLPAGGFFGDLNFFRFWDFRSPCNGSSSLFKAGFGSDAVTLGYQSWSDTEIVISGFGGTYGEGCATYQDGDPVAIAVWNTQGGGVTGPQTAWGGSAARTSGSSSSVVSGTGLPAVPSFNFEDLGLVMKVTPHIHGTEDVSLDISVEFKVLTTQSANGIPVIAARKLESKVRVRDGEWAVVAGLMSPQDAKSITGVPLLSQLPGIGKAMRQNTSSKTDTDVLLLLRPVLLDAPPDSSLVRELFLGSETRFEIPL